MMRLTMVRFGCRGVGRRCYDGGGSLDTVTCTRNRCSSLTTLGGVCGQQIGTHPLSRHHQQFWTTSSTAITNRSESSPQPANTIIIFISRFDKGFRMAIVSMMFVVECVFTRFRLPYS